MGIWTGCDRFATAEKTFSRRRGGGKGCPGKQGGVSYRVFGGNGRARGPAKLVNSGNLGQDRLTRLEVRRHGGFKIRWHSFDSAGRDLGESEQEFDSDGNPTGGQ